MARIAACYDLSAYDLVRHLLPKADDAADMLQWFDYRPVAPLETALVEAVTVPSRMSARTRGFLVAAPLALKLGCGFIMIRKRGKLPGETIGYRASHHVERLFQHVGEGCIDAVLVPSRRIVTDLIPVEMDRARLAELGVPVVLARITDEHHHDPPARSRGTPRWAMRRSAPVWLAV